MSVRTITVEQRHAEIRAQGVDSLEDVAFVCPMCKQVQSARDLIAAGAGSNLEEVQGRLGFSCFGRYTGAESPRKSPDGKPCNWTLGGLFQTHKLEVETPDGKRHPTFELATPEQAKVHAESHAKRALEVAP